MLRSYISPLILTLIVFALHSQLETSQFHHLDFTFQQLQVMFLILLILIQIYTHKANFKYYSIHDFHTGVLPYMDHIGMCRCEGYGVQADYSRIGYLNQSVWVQNKLSFCTRLTSWLKILSRLRKLRIATLGQE